MLCAACVQSSSTRGMFIPGNSAGCLAVFSCARLHGLELDADALLHLCSSALVLCLSQRHKFASWAGVYSIQTQYRASTLFHAVFCIALISHCCCSLRRPGQFQTAYDTCLASARRGGACAGVMFWDVVHHVRPALP